VKSCRRTVECI